MWSIKKLRQGGMERGGESDMTEVVYLARGM